MNLIRKQGMITHLPTNTNQKFASKWPGKPQSAVSPPHVYGSFEPRPVVWVQRIVVRPIRRKVPGGSNVPGASAIAACEGTWRHQRAGKSVPGDHPDPSESFGLRPSFRAAAIARTRSLASEPAIHSSTLSKSLPCVVLRR